MFVVVVGGGKVGYYLTKTLLSRGHEVTVIEKVPELCERIVNDMGIRAINGDGTDPAILAGADTDRADVIAAVAGHDEENLVVCQVAKKNFQVPRAVARINNPKNERIFTMLGVDAAISGTAILARAIEQEIDMADLRTLLTFKHGELEIVEAEVTTFSPLVGRPLREATVPPDSVLVTVIRGEDVIFPRGDTILEPGDSVMAVTRSGREEALRALLIGRKGQA
ncbi:MAG: potassium channel family protein [Betaproteobacteria bacterium]